MLQSAGSISSTTTNVVAGFLLGTSASSSLTFGISAAA